MLITALVAFMIAFFGRTVDPSWVGVAVFLWIGFAALALSAFGIAYMLFTGKTTPVLTQKHA
jgi:hypothetical protein